MTSVLGLDSRQSYKLFTFSNNKTIWQDHLASDIQWSAITVNLGCSDIHDRQLTHRANHSMCSAHNEQKECKHKSSTLQCNTQMEYKLESRLSNQHQHGWYSRHHGSKHKHVTEVPQPLRPSLTWTVVVGSHACLPKLFSSGPYPELLFWDKYNWQSTT